MTISDNLLRQALDGLRNVPRTLPSELLYDVMGLKLFQTVIDSPCYYAMRTELDLIREIASSYVTRFMPPEGALVDYGGSSRAKAQPLLDAMQPNYYVPVDISFDAIRRDPPRWGQPFWIIYVPGDLRQELRLPDEVAGRPLLGLCAGLTLCNFEPDEVRWILTRMRRTLGEGGHLLVSIDVVKDRATLFDAYKNAANADFVLNALARLNREGNADFNLAKFRYDPRWEEDVGRMKCRWLAKWLKVFIFKAKNSTSAKTKKSQLSIAISIQSTSLCS
jgi:L-histidine N-alpha-methyltransferase